MHNVLASPAETELAQSSPCANWLNHPNEGKNVRVSSTIEDGGSNHISGSVYPQSNSRKKGTTGVGSGVGSGIGYVGDKGESNGCVDLPIRSSSEVMAIEHQRTGGLTISSKKILIAKGSE